MFGLLIGLTPATGFSIGLVAMGFVGVMMPITNGPIFAVMQSIVAPAMQGRVFTLIGSVSGAMSPLGLVIAGPVADTLGVRAWYIVGGAACLLMGLGAFFVPAIMHIEDKPAHPGAGVSEVAAPATANPAGAAD